MRRLGFPLSATVLSLLLVAGCGASQADQAADGTFEPDRAVTMMVPASPGGGSDISGRALAAAIEDVTDVDVNVENREGAGGAVGYSYLLSQAGNPNILVASETALLSVPILQDVEFDFTDFTPIMKVADDYTLMVTTADSPFDDCADVVQAAESGRVVAGITGKAGLDNVVLTLAEQETGVEFDRVSYDSGGELLTGLLGGDVQIGSLNPGEVLGHIRSGDIKALCAFAEQRYDYPALKDIPTAKEQGIDVAFAQYRGVVAPGDLTDAQRDYWIGVLKKVLKTDAYRAWLEDGLMQPSELAGDDFTAYLKESDQTLRQAFNQ